MPKVTYPTYLALKCQNTGTKMGTNHINKQSSRFLHLFPLYNLMQITPATSFFCFSTSSRQQRTNMFKATQEKAPERLNTLTGHHLHSSLKPDAISTLTLSQASGWTARQQKLEESYLQLLTYFIFFLSFLGKWTVEKKISQSILTDGSLASSSQPHTCNFHDPCCSCAFCLLSSQHR